MLYVESLTLMTLQIETTMCYCKSMQSCMVIKTPNLRYLYLEDVPTQYDICDLSSLTEAYLAICFHDDSDDPHVLQLLAKVSRVKTLRYGTNGFFGFLFDPPTFRNLTCLKLDTDHNAFELLESAPKLKSLTFEQVSLGSLSEYVDPPECLSWIETVSFPGFEVAKRDLNLAAYLLKAASVLKEMKICMYRFSSIGLKKVYHMLLKVPRSSSACRIVIHLPGMIGDTFIIEPSNVPRPQVSPSQFIN